MTDRTRSDVSVAAAIVAVLLLIYNSNGREIGSFDSQPNKFAARELLLRGTLTLNHVVGAAPLLAERYSFVLDVNGRYRSAYSPVPAILAAGIVWPLWKTGLIDIRAPGAPAVIAVIAASLLTALAVALAYLTARIRVSRVRALFLAAGVGLGTGYWAQVSRTLWAHETAIFGIALAMLAFAVPEERISVRRAVVVAAGLALAGVARPQLAPMIALLLGGVAWRTPWRGAVAAFAIVTAAAVLLMVVNLRWFGHALGPVSLMEEFNNRAHGTTTSFRLSLDGFAGLLVSPNRGLLIFSPVVLVAFGGLRAAIVDGWRSPLRWCALAVLGQYALYSTYAVWWGGHTYGPRYLTDVLPVMVPLAAASLAQMSLTPIAVSLGTAVLVWSIGVSALGAFCYPNDRWNIDPNDVDRHHERLWSWSDMQIRRCWLSGPSPQNFSLFDRDAFRVRRSGE